MVRGAVDLAEQIGVRLGDSRVDLQQPDLIGIGVPEELDVERRIVVTDMR